MKLYFSPGACSMAPHIVLLEAGMPFTMERVSLRTKTTASGTDYTTINFKGYVPALDIGNGVVLTEVTAILQYLADQVPGQQLAPPAGTLPRYQLMEWLNFIASELHKQFSPLFSPGASDDVKAASHAMLADRIALVERTLEQRDYLMGERFTVADAYLFTVMNWAQYAAMDLSTYRSLQAYMERVAARPSVQQAIHDEGLTKK